ncbi:MAG: type IV pilus biogenesis/stability protein PilW [Pseudomonadota bacterium]
MIARFACLLVAISLTACTTTTVRVQSESSKKEAAEINAELGSRYLRAGELKKARDKLQKALEQDPKNAAANFNYGLLLARLKHAEDAEPYFASAVQHAPDEIHYHEAYGVYLCGQRRADDATDQFLFAAKNPFNQRPEQSYNNAGSCLLSLGQLDEAEQNIRAALRQNPQFPPALLNMAEVSLENRKIEVADAYFSRYLKYGQHNADSLWLGIQIKRFLGDRQTIDDYGLRLKRDFPESKQTLEYLESKEL